MEKELCHFIESLYGAKSFDAIFRIYEKEVIRLGFDGVLYTYIPKPLIDSHFHVEPVYQVSQGFSTQFLKHYAEARYDRDDPLIQAVLDGVPDPIDWWGDIVKGYTEKNAKSREVMDTTKTYGINNGVTIPLLSDPHGISGASFISRETTLFPKLLEEKLYPLQLVTSLFHHRVASNTHYLGSFIRPMLALLSETEIRYLAGLAAGKSQAEIAAELNRTVKYLEQVMLKMRRKLSGVEPYEKPTINRNQLLYYAGLMNILEYDQDNVFDKLSLARKTR